MFKYTTLKWIYFWGAVTVIVLMVAQGTDWNFWGVVIGSITLALVIVAAVVPVIRNIIHKQQLKNSFDVYYEQEEDDTKDMITISASDAPQCLNTTLRMRTEVYVESISLQFIGNGKTPEIIDFYDWYHGINVQKDPNVYTHSVIDGTRYWNYIQPHRRPAESRIKIGVSFIAPDLFDGRLEFGFTAPGVRQRKSLPFKVEKGIDNAKTKIS